MPQKALGSIVGLLCTGTSLVQGKEFCFGVNNEQYRCEMGYCCGETECCTYYYELWWFWLVWTLIIMLSCCCAYRHRRVKMRLQQEQRQREISLMAYQGASTSFISAPPLNLRFWNDCKLPDYEEVVGHPPTPPPPYSEDPPDATPTLHTESSQPAVPVLQPLVDEEPVSDTAASSSGLQAPAEPPLAEESAQAPPLEPDEDEDEELVTRRRHVTGDSGIEVCVCQLELDDGCGLEEEMEAEHHTGKVGDGHCCSGHRVTRHKPHSPDLPGQTTSTSAGDHLV